MAHKHLEFNSAAREKILHGAATHPIRTHTQEIIMTTQTRTQRRDGQTSPARRKHQPASVPYCPSSFSAATEAKELPAAHRPAWAVDRPTHEQIAARAFQLWEARGRPAGTDREDWLEAERILCEEMRWSESHISF